MNHKLDDWWQTPLGDNGMELRDLIVETLQDIMKQLEEEKRLEDKTKTSMKQIIKVIDTEYKKLVD